MGRPLRGAVDGRRRFLLQDEGAHAAMLWHGNGPVEDGCFLHNARYEVNNTALPIGASFLARLAGQFLDLSSRRLG
jgi:hypothetical protein